MRLLVVLPIVLPLANAVVAMALRSRLALQRAASVFGAVLHLAAGVALLSETSSGKLLVVAVGAWPPPFGIALVADVFGSVMVVLAGLMGTAALVYGIPTVGERRERLGFHALVHVLLMGVSGAFLTGDLFNLYVWFEVLLMASFVLLALGGERGELEGGIKYVTLNLVSSALFLTAAGLLYGTAGTLNMADLSRVFAEGGHPVLAPTLAALFFVAFGIKAAVFPLFSWLPASYHTPPVGITALFSGLLTKVGVYALVRVFTLVFAEERRAFEPLLLGVAALTMGTGVLGAVAQYDARRLLAFHIVSQIGYLLMGLALGTRLALAGTLYFMVHVVVAKSALFFAAGVAERLGGTYDLRRLGGLYRTRPFVALLFLVPALSLAGVPPLPGFFAKLALVRAGLEEGQGLLVAAALGVSLLTLFSMVKIWNEAFWKEAPEPAPEAPGLGEAPARLLTLAPLVFLAAVTGALGLLAEPMLALATRAADQLLSPALYEAAVLEGGR